MPKPPEDKEFNIHRDDILRNQGEKVRRKPEGRKQPRQKDSLTGRQAGRVLLRTISITPIHSAKLTALGGSSWLGLLLDNIHPLDIPKMKVPNKRGTKKHGEAYPKLKVHIEADWNHLVAMRPIDEILPPREILDLIVPDLPPLSDNPFLGAPQMIYDEEDDGSGEGNSDT
jgi:hypothetical protein